MAIPDIEPNYVEGRLADREVAWPRPVVVAVTGSTNADLLARAADGVPEGSVLVADEQTAGRGRMGRSWASAPGAGLWCSVLIRFGPEERGLVGRLPLLAGVSVAGAVAGAGVPAVLKWPNDVIVEHRRRDGLSGKLAGILAESDGHGAAVIGIGVNVTQPVDDLPVPEATSLALEGATASRADLLVDILTRLHGHLRDMRDNDGAGTMAEYRRLCVTVGRDVTASLPSGEVLTGRAIGIADDGRLGIHVSGKTVYVAAGDVIHATI